MLQGEIRGIEEIGKERGERLGMCVLVVEFEVGIVYGVGKSLKLIVS